MQEEPPKKKKKEKEAKEDVKDEKESKPDEPEKEKKKKKNDDSLDPGLIKRYCAAATYQAAHGKTEEARQDARDAHAEFTSTDNRDEKKRLLSLYDGDKKFKFIGKFKKGHTEKDVNEQKSIDDWITWFDAAKLWSIPDGLPNRQELAEARLRGIDGIKVRDHVCKEWADAGIKQYQSPTGFAALRTAKQKDTTYKTIEAEQALGNKQILAIEASMASGSSSSVNVKVEFPQWQKLMEIKKVITSAFTALGAKMTALKLMGLTNPEAKAMIDQAKLLEEELSTWLGGVNTLAKAHQNIF